MKLGPDRLQAHMENLPLAYIEFDHEMRVCRWSARAQEIFGWTAEEVMGMHPDEWQFVHEDDISKVAHVIRDMQEGLVHRTTCTNRNYTKEGKVVWVDWYNSALIGHNGKTQYMLCVCFEVTDKHESEMRFSSTFNQAPVGVAHLDLTGNWLLANPHLCDDFGYSYAALVQHRFLDLFVLHDQQILASHLSDLAMSRTSHISVQTKAIHKNGTPFWAQLTLSLVRNSANGPHYIVAVIENIHQRKTAEAEQRKLISLVENSNDVIAVLNLNYELLFLNRSGQRMSGSDPACNHVHVSQLFSPQLNQEKTTEIQQTVTEQGYWQGELSITDHSRETSTPVLANFFFIPDSDSIGHIACIARDITANKEAEQALRDYQMGLERTVQERMRELREAYEILSQQQQMLVHTAKMSALGEMAGTIAHEINSPLTTIAMKANQLERLAKSDEPVGDRLVKGADVISRTALRIGHIIKGLRVFAREGEHDPFEMKFLGDLIEDTFELCQLRFHNHGIRLEVGPVPPTAIIECRAVQVGQVLLNLLNNAFDAVKTLQTKWVRVEIDDHLDMVSMKVTDSGAGISHEIRDKLMQPFFTTKSLGEGTGLGLSISCEILEAHHGHLTLDQACVNTRFVASWPKQQPPQRFETPQQRRLERHFHS